MRSVRLMLTVVEPTPTEPGSDRSPPLISDEALLPIEEKAPIELASRPLCREAPKEKVGLGFVAGSLSAMP